MASQGVRVTLKNRGNLIFARRQTGGLRIDSTVATLYDTSRCLAFRLKNNLQPKGIYSSLFHIRAG